MGTDLAAELRASLARELVAALRSGERERRYRAIIRDLAGMLDEASPRWRDDPRWRNIGEVWTNPVGIDGDSMLPSCHQAVLAGSASEW